MSTTLSELASFIRERIPRESQRLCRSLQQASSGYATIPFEELRSALQRSIETICALFGDQDSAPVNAWAPQIGERRARMGLSLDDMMTVVSVIREFCWQELDAFGNDRMTLNDVRLFEDAINEFNRLLLLGYSQAMLNLQQELRAQAEQIEAQQQTIRELSTPILPLYEGILVLPLVGAIDSLRAGQIME
ncbi:MAG: STAS domain-containing protein, partial [Chloroflexus sp.]